MTKTAVKKSGATPSASQSTATTERAANPSAAKPASTGATSTKPAAGNQPTATAGNQPAAKAGKPGKPSKPRAITPEQALANTKSLLEQKKLATQQGPAYPGADNKAAPAPKDGFINQAAADRAREQELGNLQHSAIHGFADNTNREHH